MDLTPDFIKNTDNDRIVHTILLILVIFGLRLVITSLLRRNISDIKRHYHAKRLASYCIYLFAISGLGLIWFTKEGVDLSGLAQFASILGAGLAIAMHDTISNITGWAFIMLRKPFKVGERIEINGLTGDVIDIRILEFSLIEVGGHRLAGGEQSTGRILHVPNGMALRQHVANFDTGFSQIWDEIPILVTFESDWEKAKELLLDIVNRHVEKFSRTAESDIRKAAERYLIFAGKLTPIIYTTIEDSGVKLTLRYMVIPRQRRGIQQAIYEDILREFKKYPTLDFAYPTLRYYDARYESKPLSPGTPSNHKG
ncbi:hypothetical protein BVX99_03160 [bacterium F16]|nr:hypothetical protein BVX99_03160 [bacterium F16]